MKNDIKVIAAYEFLRRGYSGTNLRNEVNRFNAHLIKKVEENNPVNYPENYLRKVWKINADNNISPTEGAQIADFLQSWECNKLDIICKFIGFKMEGDTLIIELPQGTTREEAERIDAEICRHERNLKLPSDECQKVRFIWLKNQEPRKGALQPVADIIEPEAPAQSWEDFLKGNPHTPLKSLLL